MAIHNFESKLVTSHWRHQSLHKLAVYCYCSGIRGNLSVTRAELSFFLLITITTSAMALTTNDIKKRYPMHYFVWHKDIEGLRAHLQQHPNVSASWLG